MDRQSRHSSDHRDIQIAQLKAELERAYRIIDQLQWEKIHLQNQRTYTFQNGDEQPIDTPFNKRVSYSPTQRNLDSRLKNRYPHPPVKKKSENADSLYLKIQSINSIICYLLV